MPIYIGISTKNQQQISLGNTQYSKVYCGDKLVWSKGFPLANSKYGYLYNWYAATGGTFVAGWHLPSQTEFETLQTYLGGNTVAGGKLKEIGVNHWDSPNTGADNSSGFMSYGSGWRNVNGTFGYFKKNTAYRTHTVGFIPTVHWVLQTSYNFASSVIWEVEDTRGMSIRLLCDSTTDPGFVDIDGKRYKTVKIGNQVWMAENLQAKRYANGVVIPEVTDNTAWANLTTPGLCAYSNDWSNV